MLGWKFEGKVKGKPKELNEYIYIYGAQLNK